MQGAAGQGTDEKIDVGRFSDDNLKQWASDLGLDRTKFDACFVSQDTLGTVQASTRLAQQSGLSSTPSFMFNGVPLQGAPGTIEGWRQLIDSQLNATPTTEASASASAPAGTTTPGTAAAPAGSPTAAVTPTTKQ